MKKAYVKPVMFYESFALSHSIAQCDYQLQLQDVQHCSVSVDRFEDDYADVTGGFADKLVCTKEVSVYCFTTGGDGLPQIFQS